MSDCCFVHWSLCRRCSALLPTETSHHPPLQLPCFSGLPAGGRGSVWGLSSGWQWLLGKRRPVPAVTISVWLENTRRTVIIYAHRSDTSRNIAVFLHRLIDNGTLLLPGIIVRLKSQIQLIAIPGWGTEINSSRKVRPHRQPGDKKEHGRNAEAFSTCCSSKPGKQSCSPGDRLRLPSS